MSIVTCANVGRDLTRWLRNATDTDRETLCEELSCFPVGELITILPPDGAYSEEDSGGLVVGPGTVTLSDQVEGFRLDLVGPITVTPPAGHTIRSADGLTQVVADGGATLIKIGATEWWLAGNLE